MSKKSKIFSLILCLSIALVAVFGQSGINKQPVDTVLNGDDEVVQTTTKNESVQDDDNFIKEIVNNIKDFFKDEEDDLLSSEDIENIKGENDPDEPFDVTHPDQIETGLVEFSDETILVKVSKPMNEKAFNDLKDQGVEKLDVLFELEDAIWYNAYLNKDSDVTETLNKVRDLKKVMVAEYNYKYQATGTFEETLGQNPMLNQEEHLGRVGIQESWGFLNEAGLAGGSSDIKVAVIDTGVDYTHDDLKANMWVNLLETPDNNIDDDENGFVDDYYGVDMTQEFYSSEEGRYVTGKGSGMDDNGHGTHVAGIIAASNNKEGVVGIAYNTKIMAIKAGDASGYFQNDNIVRSLFYARDNGADVINMSFGGSAVSIAVQDALAVVYTDCVLVASAGNNGVHNEVYPFAIPNYPAALSYVLGVMSVDENNVESSFTNYDVSLYSTVEYEVYAPGENILSTIPGNRYAALSGTSMAAPVVAAQAALLRSYYIEPETYPTKFIYGQIVGTADQSVICIDPKSHGDHNIPGVVNYYNSFTSLPTPDIGMSDFTIFDTAGYEADKLGVSLNANELNDGDGIVDAGEIVALGFTLKNRWGMSKDTIVSIDAKSEFGVDNPYVSFLNNNLNYKSIGTYSESDSGKIYDEDGIEWTGWENPFYIKISKDCPNNYSVTLNVTIKYKNALNEEDTTEYVSKSSIMFTVTRGVELPSLIKEDMTLTKDNYYIIPNSTVVAEGVTLRIEEGTKVQFWCSDPSDAYAETAIVNLKVLGQLIVEGSEEEPVEFFPSDWMDNYIVDIYKEKDGYISLKHAIVTNPVITVNSIENCEFIQNYKNNFNYRYLSGSEVKESTRTGYINSQAVKNSAFYKLGGNNNYSEFSIVAYIVEGNIFVDSGISFNSDAQVMKNNIFYGNNNFNGTDGGAISELTLSSMQNVDIKVARITHIEETGKTYLFIDNVGNLNLDYEIFNRFAKTLGGELLSINSIEEYEFVRSELAIIDRNDMLTSITYDKYTDELINGDGTKVPEGVDFYLYNSYSSESLRNKVVMDRNELRLTSNTQHNGVVIEIDQEVLPHTIDLDEYVIYLDTETSYQIGATLLPSASIKEHLIYESEDESIATVDENGVVHGISSGTTNIKVYAKDKAVYNYLTVNVIEDVLPHYIEVEKTTTELAVGNTFDLKAKVYPINATKREIQYSSLDETIASVNDKGLVTAHKVGETTIVVTGYNGMTTEVTVKCIIPATGIEFKEDYYVTSLDKEDGKEFYPEIYPIDSTSTEFEWESSNPEVCYVNENSELVKFKEGYAVLKATLKGTTFTDEIQVVISEQSETYIVKMQQYSSSTLALDSEGNLWVWGYYDYVPKILKTGVKDFAYDGYEYSYARYRFYYIDSNDELYYANEYGDTTLQMKNVKSIESADGYSYYAITNDGYAWVKGSNSYGQLGDGSTNIRNSFIQMNFNNRVKDIAPFRTGAIILDEYNDAYLLGTTSNHSLPYLIHSNVKQIYSLKESASVEYNGYVTGYDSAGSSTYDLLYEGQITNTRGSYTSYYINDGKVFGAGHNSQGELGIGHYESTSSYTKFYEMLVVDNAKELFVFEKNTYVQTNDGKFYSIGSGSNYALGNGSTNGSAIPIQIVLGMKDNYSSLLVESTNFNEIVFGQDESAYTELELNKNEMILDFNSPFRQGNEYQVISLKDSNGTNISIKRLNDLDKLVITPLSELEDGETYTLTIPSHALITPTGKQNDNLTYTFTYNKPKEVVNEFGFIDESVNVKVDDTTQLEYTTNTLDEMKIAYTSSDPNIASVDNQGVVSGHKVGAVTITITTSTGLVDTCTVNVISPITNIQIKAETLQLSIGDEYYLRTILTPIDTTSSKTISWRSSDSSVASVTSYGLVTANKPGTATITATTSNGLEATCTVNVYGYEITDGLVKVYRGKRIKISDISNVVEETTLTNYTYNCMNKDNGTGATSSNGEFIATALGFATIIVKENGTVVEEIEVQVVSNPLVAYYVTLNENTLSLNKDETYTLTANEPQSEGNILTWTSSNEKVATVDQTGKVTAVGSGTTTITAAANIGDYDDTCTVTVNADPIIPITSVEVREELDTIAIGNGYQLHATINPEDTTLSTELTWTSSDPTVAFVNEKGEVIGVSAGSATITATSVNGLSDSFTLEVVETLDNETVVDEEKYNDRFLKADEVLTSWEDFVEKGHNTRFHSNVILNRLNNDNVDTWLRIAAPSGEYSTVIGLGGNYWGTTNSKLIEKQIFDADIYQELQDINPGEILTEAPSDTYPFVVDAYLEVNGEKVTEISNQLVTFVVEFNRPMDTSIELNVRFGSAYPYADYRISGEYVSETEWRGTTQLATLIENGYQYWSVSDGKAKDTPLKLYTDWGRFQFTIDTTAAQALVMQATPTKEGIQLTWQQDDFDTLQGYNVYRSTSKDGYYEKINRTVIPADTKEWFDDTVEPSVMYYYNFTVVQTDLTESEPSGKVNVRSMDTMAPDIYHSPVYNAFTGNDLSIGATVTDNFKLEKVTLFYRVLGETEWKSASMNASNTNKKYVGLIPSSFVTTDGLEYYIEAFDGVSYNYHGTADEPIPVTVHLAVSATDLGDVDGNGLIEIKDAAMAMLAMNDRYNLTAEEFKRADIDGDGELTSIEVLRIILYVNGKITSIQF